MTRWELRELLDQDEVLRSRDEHERVHEALSRGIELLEDVSEDYATMWVYTYLGRLLPEPGVRIIVGMDPYTGAICVDLSLSPEGHVARIFGDAYALRS